MVKIRYSELPAGLHVVVEADGRGAIIYLLPGLTPAQRRAALIRARSSARMGQGPPLPALGMAAAVAADRARTTVINGAAATRRHPMLLLPPLIVLVSGALVVVLTSVVTLTIPPHNKASFSGPRVVNPHPLPSEPGSTVSPSSSGSASSGGAAGQQGTLSPGSNTAAPGGIEPAPTPSPSSFQAAPSTSPDPTPAPSVSPSPSASASESGNCIKLGPLGLCVTV